MVRRKGKKKWKPEDVVRVALWQLARENGFKEHDWSKLGYSLSDHKIYKI